MVGSSKSEKAVNPWRETKEKVVKQIIVKIQKVKTEKNAGILVWKAHNNLAESAG